MKCTLLNEMQKGLLQRGGYCMICELSSTVSLITVLCCVISCPCLMSTCVHFLGL